MSKATVFRIVTAMALAMTGQFLAAAEPATPTPASTQQASLAVPFKWKSSGVVISPVSDDAHKLVSVKDPTVVYFGDKWHVYATTANDRGNWSMVYLSFKDWSEAINAKPYYMDANPNLTGYHCAPQVFYFRPHKKWYLIFQSQQPQYSTTDDLSRPETWTKPKDFFASKPSSAPRLWIDYWMICDDTHAYLFFTGDNGTSCPGGTTCRSSSMTTAKSISSPGAAARTRSNNLHRTSEPSSPVSATNWLAGWARGTTSTKSTASMSMCLPSPADRWTRWWRLRIPLQVLGRLNAWCKASRWA